MAPPGTYIEEVHAAVPAIAGAPTSITLFAGWTSKGPTVRAVRVASFGDFERTFGGLDPRSLLGHSLQHFFGNGGQQAWVLRITRGRTRSALSPDDADFHATLLARFAPGAAADRIDRFNLLCVPGLVHAPTLARLQAECRRRRAFLLIDAAPGATSASMVATGTAGLSGDDGTYSAMYFPWVKVADPAAAGGVRDIPPSGLVAGMIARTDAQRGVWKAPAGREAQLSGALGLSLHVADRESGDLAARGINPLRTLPGHGHVAWGARTVHPQGGAGMHWTYVPVRRTALFIEQSIDDGTRWVVFEPNGEPLWERLRLAVGSFLHGLFRQGAFMGASANTAYFVRCGRDTMTQDDIDHGRVLMQVGFAPLKPAEFVVLQVRLKAAGPAT